MNSVIKFNRIATPLILCAISTITALYFIPEISSTPVVNVREIASVSEVPSSFYLKIIGVFILSFLIAMLTFYVKQYMSIRFYFLIYTLLSTIFLAGILYYEYIHNLANYEIATICFTSTLLAIFIIYELKQRKIIEKTANGCFYGLRLSSYGKAPWNFEEQFSKKKISVLYFDVPELAKLVKNFNAKELKNIIDYIYKRSEKIISKHNGIVIRRTDDSILLAFEPCQYYEEVISPESDCAYHAVTCGLELKRMLGDMTEFFSYNGVSRLKGRVIMSTDKAMIMKHLRKGRLELSLFSESLYTINDLLKYSNGEDLIIDPKTFALTCNYFVGKDINNQSAFSIFGLSGY